MKTDIRNQNYFTLNPDALAAVSAPISDAETRGGSSLLDQMDRQFSRIVMLRAAWEASSLLASLTDLEPIQLYDHVKNLSRLSLVQNINQSSETAYRDACVAAAIMTVTRRGSMTAMEKLENAIDLLSFRYQADW